MQLLANNRNYVLEVPHLMGRKTSALNVFEFKL
ncbi:hypothetical protein DET54_11616 [Paenibacillus pabuli]|uniref:Uncharacterized protein n=1 Tax=Paenibacillus pabuli TaxID=1472 RepID=A0A855XZ45_9BACL|nr:hypothetical protein DET56_10413 [Paenibacillus pabuli]PXW07349.1 hypothetical protein DEU73_10513 [Paenibacillus taichungensis]RAI88128.1 hypothetical protein DET54_11616 [Paenibacillus pabuli]